jgi:hypothetical protein
MKIRQSEIESRELDEKDDQTRKSFDERRFRTERFRAHRDVLRTRQLQSIFETEKQRNRDERNEKLNVV